MNSNDHSMHLTINGERHAVPALSTPDSLIEQLGLAGVRLAVEVNEEIVPRSRFNDWQLSDGDSVEIVRAIGGG